MTLGLTLLIGSTLAFAGECAESLQAEVDPMIGAITLTGYGGHGLGKTFPGAATPFGMVQLSPDTITGGDNGPGYSYHHETIEGFSLTHLSGIGWYGDFGNFQAMPADAPSRFTHSNEVARANFYSVYLDDPGVKVELRATRFGQGEYTFFYPQCDRSVLKIDLARRIGELTRAKSFSSQTLEVVDDHTFQGRIVCDHRDGGWGRGEGGVDYTLYYHARLSRPLENYTIEGAPSNTVFRMTFPTERNERVRLTVTISYDSIERAAAVAAERLQLGREASTEADPWTPVFDKVRVKGGTRQQRRIFATALYHAFLDPRQVDHPGQRRTVFSGWDVFRSEMPLLTLLEPTVVEETIDSMCGLVTSGKRELLPVWDLFGCPSNCMVGNPLIPVLALARDAGLKCDYDAALDLAVATTRRRGNLDCGYTPGSLSETLEYCYDDWCIAELARRQGKFAIAEEFSARAKWYTNCWDSAVGSMRARANESGGWLEPWRGETAHWQGTVESNPLQQGWFVPHDPEGLARLMGGKDRAVAKLEEFFQKAPDDFLWGDYYNHPNEPSHHVVFLFTEWGRPDLTQKWTRRILAQAYSDDVRGLCGNDDVGQMSAWYVLAALGFNPLCPGSGRWVLSAPLFPEVQLKLGADGHVLKVRANGAEDPAKVYIRAVRVDGKDIKRRYLTTQELLSATCIEFDLADSNSP